MEKFKLSWNEWKREKFKYRNLRIWWDVIKKRIKQLAIEVSSNMKKEANLMKSRLTEEVKYLEDRKDKGENVDLELFEKNRKLRDIYSKDARGSFIRSRAKWAEEGETSSRYFHSLEKKRAKDKLWDAILDDSGQEVTGIRNILDVQKNYYKKLYKSELVDIKDDLGFLNFNRKISVTNRDSLDEKFNKDDLKKAIFMMKDNKSPGPDGISIEFYKRFFDIISDELLLLYNDIFDNDELCYTQYQAIIRLIYKKGERRDIKNWRPISLQNVDMKIISKILAERLKKTLSDIIHVDQQGCIPGRFIGQNVRLIQDIINEKDDDSVMIFLDQEKAFDRVEWKWLMMTLRHFGFGEKFIKWIRIIYKHPKSAILTNGYLSNYFELSRGIRQGDALSALLYIIQAEPLAEKIRRNKDIKGIKVESYECETEVKISQFVDDTTIFLENLEIIKIV